MTASGQGDGIARLDKLIEKGRNVLLSHRPNPPNVVGFPTLDSGEFAEWRSQSLACLSDLFGSGHIYPRDFGEKVAKGYQSVAEAGIGILKAAREDIKNRPADDGVQPASSSPLLSLEQVADRFHLVARQLRSRHDGRETLSVADEYDVQDLVHSLLWLYFEDVRAEEWTPSYAGKSSRMDFLLKAEQVVVEIKKTRVGLGAKEVGSQLIEDIARYQAHPDCAALVCFVYDPDGLVSNPRGVERDLSRDTPLPVRVFIRPK